MSLDQSVLEQEFDWHKIVEGDFIYYRKNTTWKIRMNSFPGEPLYTLFVDCQGVLDFDEWPDNWHKMD